MNSKILPGSGGACSLQRFFEPDEEDQRAWGHLQRCAARPALMQAHSGFDRPVAFEVLLEMLAQELARARHPAGFFSGAVTFAEMQPMRAIPFRVICLIGMNDHAFPRQAFPPGFHLIPHTRRPGDRESGKDDRYIFLEALLSARDAFIVTYTGQSQQDNAQLRKRTKTYRSNTSPTTAPFNYPLDTDLTITHTVSVPNANAAALSP